ncbi:MAG: hypothetical protein V3T84_14705 [Phycisphaerales bacterium]
MKRSQGFAEPFTGCLLGVAACTASLGFSSIGWANHEHVKYCFDDMNTTGWSSRVTSTIRGYSGGVFLGEFGKETVSLFILDALPAGDDPDERKSDRCTTLSFDVLATGTWIGNRGSFFSVTANGQELVFTTFATPGSGLDQAYPDDYPDGSHPAGTGAVEFFGKNAVYHFDLSFPLFWQEPCCTDIVIDFSAMGFAPAHWGLDNVVVDWSQLLPCPAACPWDIDGNDLVGASDLLALLVSWGPCKGCPADFDGNGTVGASDLLALLVNWGPCP